MLRKSPSTILARWIIINTLIIALLVTAYVQGTLDEMLYTTTHMIPVIAVISFIFTLMSGWTALVIQRSWGDLENQKNLCMNATVNNVSAEFRDHLGETLQRRIAIYRIAGPLLGSVGLFGTILGISLGFASLSPEVLSDPSIAQTAMVGVLTGLATSFHSTMAGIAAMVWNMLNHHMLRQESSRFYTSVTEV